MDTKTITREEAVKNYRWLVTEFWPEKTREKIRTALRGKNLACWCPLGQPCHADVLLEIANGARAGQGVRP